MKKEETVRRAIGGIDDSLIEGAERIAPVKTVRKSRLRIGAVAAAAVLAAALGAVLIPGILKNDVPVPPDTPNTRRAAEKGDGGDEYKFEKAYGYSVDGGKYASFVGGKAIAKKYLGGKLDDVTVTAGWFDADGKRLTEEHARAEIYGIRGVPADVAVAIRFIDELEAEATDLFFVIMDPEADLTPVQPWVITRAPAGQLDDGEIPE